MDAFEAEVSQSGDVEVLPDVELGQDIRRARLTLRNHDAVAATVARGEGVPPAGPVFRELASCEAGAVAVVVLDDPIGERPLVEVRRPVLGYLFVGIGQIPVHDDLSRAGDAALGEENSGKLRKARHLALQLGDEVDHHRSSRYSPAGVFDSRLQGFRKAPGAVSFEHLGPTRQGPREHGRSHVPVLIARRRAPLVDGEVVRCETAEIQTFHFAGIGKVQHQDSVAADTREIGFVDAQNRRDGDRGVDCVAAVHEHFQSCCGGERTGRCHDAPCPHHRRHCASRFQGRCPRPT